MTLSQTTTQKQDQKQKQVQRISQQQLQRQKMLGLQTEEMMQEIGKALDENPLLEVSAPEEGDVDYAEPEEQNDDNGEGDRGEDDEEPRKQDKEDEDGEDDGTSEEMKTLSPSEIFDFLNFEDDDKEDETSRSLQIPDDFETRHDEWHTEVLSTPHLSDEERFVAEAIVDDLSPSGMLATPLQDIAMMCQVGMSVAERAMAFIQSLSPAGVGARDVIEYLSLQLDRISCPSVDKAMAILSAWRAVCEEFVPKLESADNGTDSSGKSGKKGNTAGMDSVRANAIMMTPAVFGRLSGVSGLSEEDFHEGGKLLAGLRWPGAAELMESDKLVPEVEILPDYKGKLVADYIPGPWSRLKVIDSLPGTSKSAEVQQYYKKKLDNANGFVDSIRFRMDTVTALAQLLADVQGEFLKTGDRSRIVPFSKKDAAAKLGLDASTISRASSDKLVKTPIGTMPMKKIFELSTPSRLPVSPGEAPVTNDVIMETVREVIESEPKGKPYSDQKIADILNERGIEIALRTVTKYRHKLGIGNTSLRRNAGQH